MSPFSPLDSIASFAKSETDDEWIVPGICAYVPQVCCSLLLCFYRLKDGIDSVASQPIDQRFAFDFDNLVFMLLRPINRQHSLQFTVPCWPL